MRISNNNNNIFVIWQSCSTIFPWNYRDQTHIQCVYMCHIYTLYVCHMYTLYVCVIYTHYMYTHTCVCLFSLPHRETSDKLSCKEQTQWILPVVYMKAKQNLSRMLLKDSLLNCLLKLKRNLSHRKHVSRDSSGMRPTPISITAPFWTGLFQLFTLYSKWTIFCWFLIYTLVWKYLRYLIVIFNSSLNICLLTPGASYVL